MTTADDKAREFLAICMAIGPKLAEMTAKDISYSSMRIPCVDVTAKDDGTCTLSAANALLLLVRDPAIIKLLLGALKGDEPARSPN